MKKFNVYQAFLFILLSFFTLTSFAWNHSIELGYGYSHDPNHSKFKNSGALLSADLFPIYRNCWSFWTINGAVGQWHSTAPRNKNLTTGAIALALRIYPFDFGDHPAYPAYLLGSAGPAYISHRQFGKNKQGSNFTFQVNVGAGVEFKPFDVNFRFVHYSNARLSHPDEGFTILYMLSIGYLFDV